MTDTYEFLKSQKDAILAKQEDDRWAWMEAATADIAHYRKRIAELESDLEHDKLIIQTAEQRSESLLQNMNSIYDELKRLRKEQTALTAASHGEQASKRVPLTDEQVVEGYCNCKSVHQFVQAFEQGIRFAEKHHGITGEQT